MPQTMIDFDHLPYLGSFLAGIVVALTFGAYLFARSRARLPFERLCLMLCPVVAYLSLSMVAHRIALAPDHDWNAARLASAVGLLFGCKLYVGPYGPGAILQAIDPPLSYLLYAPAGLFSTPTHAIIAGSCISFALYLAPAAALGFWRPRDEGGGRSSLMGAVTVIGFCQAPLVFLPLALAAFFINSYATMLSFAGFACLALVLRPRSEANLSLSTCLASAICASMAIWSEQWAAPLILALPIWVLATRGFRQGLRYMACLVMALAATTLLVRTFFGVSSIFFNVIEIPRKHLSMSQGWGLVRSMLGVLPELFCCTFALVASTLLALLARRSFAPAIDRRWAGFRRLLVGNPWLLFVFVALTAIPTSLRARIDLNGYMQDFSLILYFLLLALMALLLDWQASNRRRGLEASNAVMAFVMLLLVLSPSTISEDYFSAINNAHRPSKNPQEIAYQYSRQHPGTAYFPWNPLSTLLAERQAYHFEFGLVDREMSGYPVGHDHFRSNLPANLRYVCFPPHNRDFGGLYEKTMRYLPEFSRRVEVDGLPDWTCYERDPSFID